MVTFSELHHARWGSRLPKPLGAGLTVAQAPPHRSSHLPPRIRGSDAPRDAGMAGEDVDHAIDATLVALADVVEGCCRDQVGVVVAAIQQPPRRIRAVDDVARVLGGKQLVEGGREPGTPEREIVVGRDTVCMTELADPVSNHRTRLNTSSWTARMIQVMGLRPTKLSKNNTIRGIHCTRASRSRSCWEMGSGARPQTTL